MKNSNINIKETVQKILVLAFIVLIVLLGSIDMDKTSKAIEERKNETTVSYIAEF